MIEELKDLNDLSVDELVGSLMTQAKKKAQEERVT
jgi:hypothetical protein